MLAKVFIKDYENIHNRCVRNKYGVIAGVFGVISNLFIGILKLIIGILSSSVSVMVDSVNNITDSFSSVLTIIGFSLVNKKPTKHHPYGFARYEYICGFVILGAIFTTAISSGYGFLNNLTIINKKISYYFKHKIPHFSNIIYQYQK